jgi:uncharacterized protein (TIGR02677 family)
VGGLTDADGELPEQAEGADSWMLAGLPGRVPVASYLVSRFAAQYRVIVDVLLAEQDNSLTGLSYDEIAAAVSTRLARIFTAELAEELATDEAWNLQARLDSLVLWDVITSWQEPARSGEDFLRRRDRFQLTPAAARLHSFWTDPQSQDQASEGDLTLAPRAIHDRLVAFARAIRDQRFADAAGEFQQVITLHQAMATAARGWQRGLAHAVSGGPDEAKQEMLWRTLQAYVAMWGEQVDVNSPRIAEVVRELDPLLTNSSWRACVRAALADDVTDALVDSQVERWTHTWAALAAWFAWPTGQARRLRRQLRGLVAPWARNMSILMDSAGSVTRRPELLRLASALEQASSDEEAWRLWYTAAGTYSARHLLLPADSADDSVQPWSDAPGAPVSGRFRRQGHRAAVGRRAVTPDYGAGKAAARQARRAALAERREAEVSLRERSGTTVDTWGTLTLAEFDLLKEFVGAVRRGGGAIGGRNAAVTSDGRWKVRLIAAPGTGSAVLETENGSWVTPAWLFEMRRP